MIYIRKSKVHKNLEKRIKRLTSILRDLQEKLNERNRKRREKISKREELLVNTEYYAYIPGKEEDSYVEVALKLHEEQPLDNQYLATRHVVKKVSNGQIVKFTYTDHKRRGHNLVPISKLYAKEFFFKSIENYNKLSREYRNFNNASN